MSVHIAHDVIVMKIECACTMCCLHAVYAKYDVQAGPDMRSACGLLQQRGGGGGGLQQAFHMCAI